MQSGHRTIEGMSCGYRAAHVHRALDGVEGVQPIAAGVLFPASGLLLSPFLASAAMAFRSVSVVANSLRLRSARLA